MGNQHTYEQDGPTYHRKDDAMRHASELRDEGALVRIVKTERNGRTYYRVMRAI